MKKHVEVAVIVEVREVEGVEFGEPIEETREEKSFFQFDTERKQKTIGDGEELLVDKGVTIQVAMLFVFITVVDDESKDTFPTLIR